MIKFLIMPEHSQERKDKIINNITREDIDRTIHDIQKKFLGNKYHVDRANQQTFHVNVNYKKLDNRKIKNGRESGNKLSRSISADKKSSKSQSPDKRDKLLLPPIKRDSNELLRASSQALSQQPERSNAIKTTLNLG